MIWAMLHCAVQGRGHLKSETPCQDKTFVLVKDGCSVCALADGAGSASLSHFGAERVTQSICDYMAENFDLIFSEEDGVTVKRRILAAVGGWLDALCGEKGCSVRDLASTLLVVAEKGGSFICCHLGDGVIGYVKDGRVLVASHPENGEFANTTVFTTSGDALSSIKLIKGNLGQISGFVLMSDGTETSFYNKRRRTLMPVLARLLRLVSICDSDFMSKKLYDSFENQVRQRTTDDCSIVLMSRYLGGPGYMHFSSRDKCDLLGLVDTRVTRKRLKSFENVLMHLGSWETCRSIKRRLHLRGKKLDRILNRLLRANLVQTREDGCYRSTLTGYL